MSLRGKFAGSSAKAEKMHKDIQFVRKLVFNTTIKAHTTHNGKVVEITKDNFNEVILNAGI